MPRATIPILIASIVSAAILWFLWASPAHLDHAIQLQYAAYCVDPGGSPFPPSEEDYAVYQAIFDNSYRGSLLSIDSVASDEFAVPAYIDLGQSDRTENFAPDRETTAGFNYANREPISFDRSRLSRLPVILTSDAELREKVFTEGTPLREAWKKINGSLVVRVSRVGFNCNLSEALVYLSETCGELCGGGWLFLLRKVDGTWQVAGRSLRWIS
jgi:hypothetical protein